MSKRATTRATTRSTTRSTTKRARQTERHVERLTELPAGYALLRIGGRLLPARIISAPEEGAQDASTTHVYYRELSRDGRAPALCATEQEALDVIAEALAKRAQDAEGERLAGLARARDAQQGDLWAGAAHAAKTSRSKKAQKVSAA